MLALNVFRKGGIHLGLSPKFMWVIDYGIPVPGRNEEKLLKESCGMSR